MGYLAQNTGLESNLSIWEEMLTVFSELQAQERQLRALEMKMSDSTVIENETEYEKVLKGIRSSYRFNLKNRAVINLKQISALFYTA